jgi:hypothetical protein
MAELLVNVETGEVLFVAKDGHQWGRQECREVYDAYIAAFKRPPQAVRRGTYEVTRTIVFREKEYTYVEHLPIPQSEELVEVPPPSRLGVVVVPDADQQDFAALIEADEKGQRKTVLELDSTERARILAGKVTRTKEDVTRASRARQDNGTRG